MAEPQARSRQVHPYNDRVYVESLPESSELRQHYANLLGEKGSSSIAQSHSTSTAQHSGSAAASSSSGSGARLSAEPEKKTLGRKLKDSLTGSTHDERVRQRKDKHEQVGLESEPSRRVRRS